jgi:hypothetical protein
VIAVCFFRVFEHYQGADVHAQLTTGGMNAIWLAAQEGRVEVLEWLVNLKVDLNLREIRFFCSCFGSFQSPRFFFCSGLKAPNSVVCCQQERGI